MPGEYQDKFSNLRAFYGYMMAHPGKKLMFMGGEFAQFIEWNYSGQLDWMLLDYPNHKQMQQFVKDLNKFYLEHSAFWENDTDWNGFKWISCDNYQQNIISFMRINKTGEKIITVCNFCPVKRENYLIGVPDSGTYKCVFSSDKARYGGSTTRLTSVRTKKIPMHGYDQSVELTIPAMSTTYYIIKE
jgi:1,4-alpha-glucan branching enzyme